MQRTGRSGRWEAGPRRPNRKSRIRTVHRATNHEGTGSPALLNFPHILKEALLDTQGHPESLRSDLPYFASLVIHPFSFPREDSAYRGRGRQRYEPHERVHPYMGREASRRLRRTSAARETWPGTRPWGRLPWEGLRLVGTTVGLQPRCVSLPQPSSATRLNKISILL